MKKLFLKIAFSIIAIPALFIFLELTAKFINPVFKVPHGDVALGVGGKDIFEYPSGYIKDRDLFWKLDPSCGEYNSLGFWDREVFLKKNSDVFRIICMGDSVTFGWPNEKDRTYPKRLEKLLNLEFPKKKFEVFNAGVPGYTSYQGLVWLKRDILKCNPDLIIIYFGINDRSASYKSDKEQIKLPEWIIIGANFLRNFHFYNLLNKIILYVRFPPGEAQLYKTHRVPLEDFKNNLLSIKVICEQNKIRTLFIVHPVLYNREKKKVFSDINYDYPKDILEFDIHSIFKKKEKEAAELFVDDIRPDNFHLTDKGQKILAEEIFKTLINGNIISE